MSLMIGLGLGLGGRAGGASTFDPATLSLTGWWRASYAGSPWVATASAGTSGSREFSEATNPPGTFAINGLNAADFDGTNDRLRTVTLTLQDLLGTSGYYVGILAYLDTTEAAGANYYDDEALFTTDSGGMGISVSNSGVRAGHNDGGYKQTAAVACATGAWKWIDAWYDTTNLNVAVNGGAAASVAAGACASPGGQQPRVGSNWAGAKFLDGKVAEIITAASDIGATNRTGLRSYVNARYGLSL